MGHRLLQPQQIKRICNSPDWAEYWWMFHEIGINKLTKVNCRRRVLLCKNNDLNSRVTHWTGPRLALNQSRVNSVITRNSWNHIVVLVGIGLLQSLGVNSLWPSDARWWQRSGSTLAQVMAWCLTAPSHYLNQCWLIISEVQWHSY